MDSPDLSLNISREMLQHDRQLNMIKSNLEKKIKAELLRLMEEEPETYGEFYRNFGRQLKYGIVEDYGMKAELLKDLIMFHSYEKDEPITLKSYVESMPEGQEKIYFATAESVTRAKQLPQTEQVRDKGYDILCLTEDVDEFVTRTLREYEGKEFCDVSGNDLGLETEEEMKNSEEREEAEKDTLDFIKDILGDKVSSVKLSRKLKTHAVCLTSEGDVSLEMEKYFSSIPGEQSEMVKAKRVLEINPDHPAYSALKDAIGREGGRAESMARILYGQAVLIAGMPMDDVLDLSEDIFKLF